MQLECFAYLKLLSSDARSDTVSSLSHCLYLGMQANIQHSFFHRMFTECYCVQCTELEIDKNKQIKIPTTAFPYRNHGTSIKELCIVPNVLMNFKPLTHTHSHALSSLCTNNNKIGHTHIL